MSIAAAAQAQRTTATATPQRPDLEAELNNLAMSKDAQPLFDAVKAHIDENVAPMIEEFFRRGEGLHHHQHAGRRNSDEHRSPTERPDHDDSWNH